MKLPWYWRVVVGILDCGACTLQDLKALPIRNRLIRFYMLSLAARLMPLIDRLRTGSADEGSDFRDTLIAQLTPITGDGRMAEDIYKNYLGKARAISTRKAIIAIFEEARPEFATKMADDPDTIPRYLRSRPDDERFALAWIVETEKVRKPGAKRTLLDDLLRDNTDDIAAVAKAVKTALGKIESEEAVLKYLRGSIGDKPAESVEVVRQSRPNWPIELTKALTGWQQLKGETLARSLESLLNSSCQRLAHSQRQARSGHYLVSPQRGQ